ncbi:MAG: hypothetical protein Cpurp_12980 [Chlorogloea purpurea SAG 13.99]|jgi:hypothetical protein|nr:hypothetical protein [Chlorogloea purpurea SAG 13.99]
MRSYQELCNLFSKLNIDYSQPGFYDHPSFLKSEKEDKYFLENYADFVLAKKYDTDYLSTAKKVVTNFATFLYSELEKDGLLGACLDLSMAMSKMLDKENIWNFVSKGNLTIKFHPEVPLPAEDQIAYFPSITPYANIGHAWLYAPPFSIVDLTISSQKLNNLQKQCLPKLILREEVPTKISLRDITLEDVVHHDAPSFADLSQLRTFSGLPIKNIDSLLEANGGGGLIERINKYGAFQVKYDSATLKYISNGVTAGDMPLEKISNITLGDKSPNELYKKYCELYK